MTHYLSLFYSFVAGTKDDPKSNTKVYVMTKEGSSDPTCELVELLF